VLFHRLSDKVTDVREKLSPSISYLQKLGPEHLRQIFDTSRWLFEQDRDMAYEVCFFDQITKLVSSVS
jgi:hypothetical protein